MNTVVVSAKGGRSAEGESGSTREEVCTEGRAAVVVEIVVIVDSEIPEDIVRSVATRAVDVGSGSASVVGPCTTRRCLYPVRLPVRNSTVRCVIGTSRPRYRRPLRTCRTSRGSRGITSETSDVTTSTY